MTSFFGKLQEEFVEISVDSQLCEINTVSIKISM